MDELLIVENIKKSFPVLKGLLRRTVDTIRAVDDVSFTLKGGEVLGIVGESGCGKSTLARTILRLIEPTSGRVIFDGQELFTLDRKALKNMRKEMQIVFQNPAQSLNPRKLISEIIGEVLEYHHIVTTEEEKIKTIEELLEKVGLEKHMLSRYPHEFSIGQQQRLCIARALSTKPKLLVLDECVSALDVSVQAQILNLLQDLQKEFSMSYIFISHDLAVVEHISDRVLVMYGGKVVEEGNATDVLKNPKDPYTKLLVSSILPEKPRKRKKN